MGSCAASKSVCNIKIHRRFEQLDDQLLAAMKLYLSFHAKKGTSPEGENIPKAFFKAKNGPSQFFFQIYPSRRCSSSRFEHPQTRS